jgi:hypothetical protein
MQLGTTLEKTRKSKFNLAISIVKYKHTANQSMRINNR